MKDGKIVYTRAFGLANIAPARPTTPEMEYPIGSVFKQFTATAALILQQEGKLSLDGNIEQLLVVGKV